MTVRRSRPLRRWMHVGLWLVCVAWAGPRGAGAAQDTGTPPAPATGPTRVVLTVEALQARIKQAEEQKDLAPQVKATLIALYKQTIEDVQTLAQRTADAAQFRKAAAEAPAMLNKVREECARASVSPPAPDRAGATLAQLEQELTQAAAMLDTARKRTTELELDHKHRLERQGAIPTKLIVEANRALAATVDALGKAGAADEPVGVTAARRAMLRAKKRAIEQDVSALREELASYEAGRDLAAARLDLASRRVTQTEQLVKARQLDVNQARREEAAKQVREARRAAATAQPTVRQLAQENAALAERRAGATGLAARIEKIAPYQKHVTETLNALSDDFNSVKEKVETPGLANLMGLLLRKKRAELPDIRQYRARLRSRQPEIAAAQLARMELVEMRAGLRDIEAQIAKAMAELDPSIASADRAEIESAVRKLLTTRREVLQSLMNDYDTYITGSVDVALLERQLITAVQQ